MLSNDVVTPLIYQNVREAMTQRSTGTGNWLLKLARHEQQNKSLRHESISLAFAPKNVFVFFSSPILTTILHFAVREGAGALLGEGSVPLAHRRTLPEHLGIRYLAQKYIDSSLKVS